MSDIAILKEMLKNSATVSLEKHPHGNNKKQVTLREPGLPECFVTIYGMPDDDQVIVIKTDAFISPKAVFTGSKGECKRADFVIVASTGTKRVILCIEMKAKVKTSSESEIIQQLKGAQCFVGYCREIGNIFWEQQNFLGSYAYRFVTIRNISVSKKQTRVTRQAGFHDQPNRMLKISAPNHLQFNQLVGAS